MKFTVNWLKQYIDFDFTPDELADRLTMAGLEVDSVDALFHGLDEVRVAKIVEVAPHPNADKLSLCEVAVGPERYRVVCGAPNAAVGMLTAIALPGVTLPSGLKIKKSKIRGESSIGMLCSERDLGISEEHSGIMELPETLEHGQSLIEALELKDTLIEVDLTPNRPDCTSVIGVAREVAGFTRGNISQPIEKELPALTGEGVPFAVDVESPEDCPRYAARLLRNVTIAPSPWWLKKRLLSIGLRPINNVVDITNFVMLEYGQPLHAFDFDELAGHRIVVRKPAPGETITTLDGTKRELDPEMLLICDAERPVAVAGVMGGGNSEVSDATTDVLLESACFNPISIRRTSRMLKLGTDASYRFERGVDPELAPRALERVVQLMVAITGAKVVNNGVDFCEGIAEPPVLSLRVKKTCDLLGMDFSADDLIDFLTSIEIRAEKKDEDTLTVRPPSFRVDLEREIDLVEEIARLKGFNDIPSALPMVPMSFAERDQGRDLQKQAASILTSLGFYEAINYSFVSERHFDMLGLEAEDPLRTVVRLLNPIAEDQSVMRTMLLPGLLENVCRNINHQTTDVRLFEIGKVFHPTGGDQPDEKVRLAAVMSGRRHPGSSRLYFAEELVDIFDAKGAVEQLMEGFRLPQVEFLLAEGAPKRYVDPGSFFELKVDGKEIGCVGMLAKKALKQFGIKQDCFFLDIHLDELVELAAAPKIFTPLPKFQAVSWDIAVLVPEDVQAGQMIEAIGSFDDPLVQSADIFDVYRGKPIEDGIKSVAISVTYRSSEKTLDDETVGRVHEKIIDMILSRFNGRLREV